MNEPAKRMRRAGGVLVALLQLGEWDKDYGLWKSNDH